MNQQQDNSLAQSTSIPQPDNEYAQFFALSLDLMCIMDFSGSFQHLNSAWTTALGWNDEELNAKPFIEFIHPDDQQATQAALTKMVKNQDSITCFESRCLCKDGASRWLRWSAVPHSQQQLIYLTARDITDKRSEEQAKSSFLSVASHQLRTPLTAIKWTLESFLSGKCGSVSESQQALLQRAHKSAGYMADSIRTMLMVARVDTQQIDFNPVALNLHDLLQAVTGEHRADVEAKHLDLQIDCADDCELQTDPALLQEVIFHLFSNAVRYTPEHGNVTIRAEHTNESVSLTVADTGCGIPAAEQHKVFSKFFRARNAMEQTTDGIGLGLHIVHALAGILGGDVQFRSVENEGTTFSVTLPLTPAHHEPGNSHR